MHRVGLGDGRTAVSYGWTYCQQENRLIQSFGGNWSIVVKIRKCGSRSHISPLNKRQHLGDNFVIYDNIGSWEGGRGGGWLKLCFWRTYLSAVFRHTWINSRWLFFPSIWGTRWWDFTVLVSCPHVISLALVHPLLLLLSLSSSQPPSQHPPRLSFSATPPPPEDLLQTSRLPLGSSSKAGQGCSLPLRGCLWVVNNFYWCSFCIKW